MCRVANAELARSGSSVRINSGDIERARRAQNLVLDKTPAGLSRRWKIKAGDFEAGSENHRDFLAVAFAEQLDGAPVEISSSSTGYVTEERPAPHVGCACQMKRL